jgi:hypothetical protein
VLGYKQYYRLTFDVSGQGLFFGTGETKLTHIYDYMQDSGAFTPLSANPVGSGDTVMVVDAITIPSGQSLSLAEGVRRLEEVAGGMYSSVRSVQKLVGIGDVTGGASSRDQTAADTNAANDKNSFGHQLTDLLAGFGHYTTLAVIGLVAYAVIVMSPTLSAFGRRR